MDQLTDPNAVWILKTRDYHRPSHHLLMKLKFYNNGYAYEENTILKYPYQIYPQNNLFEINYVRYRIVSVESKKIILSNIQTGIEVEITKE